MSEPEKSKQVPTPKSPDPPQGYAAGMQKEDYTSRGALGQPLITINPKDLDAQARIQSIIGTATHSTVAAWATEKEEWVTVEGVKFPINTLSGIMSLWEYEYKKKSIALDGKARQEYVDVSKLEAIGPSEDSMLAQSVLNEGAKNLSSKKEGKK